MKWPALSSSSRELNCSKQKKRQCCEQVNPPLTNFNSFTFFSQKKKHPNFQYAGDVIMDYAGDIQN
jgi:hypothetical protein